MSYDQDISMLISAKISSQEYCFIFIFFREFTERASILHD